MPTEKLHATLEELHRQLESTENLDDEARQHLIAAMDEIRATLTKTAEERALQARDREDGDEGPIDRLRGMVEHFEEDHPMLSARLLDLIAILRSMGF